MFLPSSSRKLIFLILGVLALWVDQAAAAEKEYQALTIAVFWPPWMV